MNIYAFITKDNFRVEVEASSPIAGYNKLKSIPYFKDKNITKSYYKYDSNGFAAIYDIRYLEGE